ncbi:hypothetical protein [Danxiaibacter flavus]|uniref:hypothetical protein n=1 Tax=Danxiaibacter flavus TaxID=3049108 RepID=UPI0034E0DDEA|nr:hypothetical protein QNM32_10145 [Chitinophagaceae bacterium DXS]
MQLTMFLRNAWERYGKAAEELQQSVAVPTPHKGIRLLLSGKEIEQVYCMLENADTGWRSQQLLELFE